MKLKEYVAILNEISKKNGNGELDCYYSSDDEGNNYSKVFYAPSVEKTDDLDINITDKRIVIIN